MSVEMSEERLSAIGAALARIEANMATKADLAAAIAGVERNIDVTALGKQLRETQDELRVTSAIVLRLDHALPDITQQLNAMVRQQIGIIDQLRALENENQS
jgi:hypothetical protein